MVFIKKSIDITTTVNEVARARAETMRDPRLWAIGAILETYLLYKNDVDPWSTRQALITALEMDTEAALNRGIDYGYLVKFDTGARAEAKKLIDQLKM